MSSTATFTCVEEFAVVPHASRWHITLQLSVHEQRDLESACPTLQIVTMSKRCNPAKLRHHSDTCVGGGPGSSRFGTTKRHTQYSFSSNQYCRPWPYCGVLDCSVGAQRHCRAGAALPKALATSDPYPTHSVADTSTQLGIIAHPANLQRQVEHLYLDGRDSTPAAGSNAP